MSVDPAQLNFLEDGIYGGKFNEAGGPYRVKVKIQNHKITEIKSIQNRESHYVKLAEGIFYKVKDSQQIDLDGISGATTTSKCFLKAIENALSDPENLRQ